MKWYLVLALNFYSWQVFAMDFKKEAIIKIDKDLSVEVHASPSFQEKKMTTVLLKIAGKSNAKVKSFDAEMPEHMHGMITKATPPKYDNKKKGYIVKGVKLHMPGHWLLKLKVDRSGKISEHNVSYQLAH